MTALKIAVSGINAIDNPGPGVAVIRSLKEQAEYEVNIIGLAYDAMDPGVYLDWLMDKVYLMPYPSAGEEAFLERIYHIKESYGLDVLIPTLDSELPLYMKVADQLEAMGIKTFLPNREQYDLRAKNNLVRIGKDIGLSVPKTFTLSSMEEIDDALDQLSYPVMVKGIFYKAYTAYTRKEVLSCFSKVVEEWGYPVIIQEKVTGEEMNVICLGDGLGGHLGMVSIKKLWITSLGKIWTGVTIKHQVMENAVLKFLESYQWRGAFELECMVNQDSIYLIEINPRFPAWVYFATGAGVNLPLNQLKASLGEENIPVSDYAAGKLYVRYTYEVISDMETFQNLTIKGEL